MGVKVGVMGEEVRGVTIIENAIHKTCYDSIQITQQEK